MVNNDLGSAVKTSGDQDAVSLADAARATIIRCLNDTFRTTFTGGQIMLTRGIIALGGEAQRIILERVRAFDEFHTGNDPHGEHDFGAFEHAGDTVAFKIDYYDLALAHGSENPADVTITRRVMTIMLLEEW
jgi:hypothetical protein